MGQLNTFMDRPMGHLYTNEKPMGGPRVNYYVPTEDGWIIYWRYMGVAWVTHG